MYPESVPEEVTTWVVNVELLPPPCSIWRIRAISSTCASTSVYFISGDEAQVEEYLKKLLHKEAFDKKGLIYGMGHAIYSASDPRAEVFKITIIYFGKIREPAQQLSYLYLSNALPSVHTLPHPSRSYRQDE